MIVNKTTQCDAKPVLRLPLTLQTKNIYPTKHGLQVMVVENNKLPRGANLSMDRPQSTKGEKAGYKFSDGRSNGKVPKPSAIRWF